jgi:hypothetical protein
VNTKEKREFIMWSMTSFPFGDCETICKQIQEAYDEFTHGKIFIGLEGWKEDSMSKTTPTGLHDTKQSPEVDK